MDSARKEREIDELGRELDTLHLDESRVSMYIGELHRIVEMDITGWFAFDEHGGLSGFDFHGMCSTSREHYRQGVIRADRPWGFFDPWAVPLPQRNRSVVFQALQFLHGCHSTRRRLGLPRAGYEQVRRAFEANSIWFYERYGYAPLWQLRALITNGGRLVGWVGGLCERKPTREQRRLFERVLPNFIRHTRHVRLANTSSTDLVEVLLERVDRPSYLVDGAGRIAHANQRGVAVLDDVIDEVRAASRDGTSSNYEVIAVRGTPAMSLVMGRSCPAKLRFSQFGLTPRQADVAAVLCTGASNREIADRLQISERTVEVHLTALYERLGVEQRAAAIARLLDSTT